tara:strand:+ start:2424 stop:3632 length:1209 start_codon:yes stop_codon:yes gene_type:complete
MDHSKKTGVLLCLDEDRTLEFEAGLESLIPGYRYIDWRITPILKPSRSCGEDAFRWDHTWKAKIGLHDESVITDSSIGIKTRDYLSKYADEFGWHLVTNLKQEFPVPWDNSSFFITLYKGHKSWDKSLIPTPQRTWSHSVGVGTPRRIVGVMQVKNSELIVEKTIENIMPLLDWLIVLDNESSDSTPSIVREIASHDPRILTKDILTTESGARYLHSLCGTDTVIVKVDADEIWNPFYVTWLRDYLLCANVVNTCEFEIPSGQIYVNGVDLNNNVCTGKPESWNGMHYFGNIIAWPQQSERLHGPKKKIRAGTRSQPVQLGGPRGSYPILHFPFFQFSKEKTWGKKLGWEQHKVSYVEPDPKKWKVESLDEFGVTSVMSQLLGNEKMWVVPGEFINAALERE